MKNIIFSILTILTVPCFGQKGPGNFFYYYKDSAINLSLDSSKIYVKFTPTSSPEERLSAITNVFNISEESTNKLLSSGKNFAVLNITGNLSETQIVNKLASLKTDPSLTYVAPVITNGTKSQAITEKFIVKLKEPSQANLSELDSLLNGNGDSVSQRISWDNNILIIECTKVSTQNALQQANLFYQTHIFEFCEPDYLALNVFESLTNDTYSSNQWGLQNTGSIGTAGTDINVTQAWQMTSGGDPNIKIAIIDLGVDLTHPDLIGNLLPGYDATFVGNGGFDHTQTNNSMGGPAAGDFHGTGCAGIAAATANNNIGIAGVAYNCKIVPVRAGINNSFWVSDAANAIHWAASPTGGNADVLSNSYGGFSQSSLMDNAINYAVTSGRNGLGCVLAFATGNGNGGVAQSTIAYPSSNSNVLSVGASDEWGGIAGAKTANPSYLVYSNYGTGLDVVAPGGSVDLSNTFSSGDPKGTIYTTVPPGSAFDDLGGGYTDGFNGTSAACPFAAGVAALVLSVNQCLSYRSVINIIEFTCTKQTSTAQPLSMDNSTQIPKIFCYNSGLANGSWNTYLGYGRVNAGEAVTVAYTSEPFVVNILHEQNPGSQGGQSKVLFVNGGADCSNSLATDVYFFYPYMVTANITYPYTINPILAPGSVANGWSAANPNYGDYFCGITNVTNTSATLYTYAYAVYDLTGNPLGYFPDLPTRVVFQYAIVSALPGGNLFFQNQNVNFTNNYSAIYTIDAGYNVTNAVPLGNYVVLNGADIGFHAEESIDLHDGFQALNGSIFDAAIGPAFYPCSEYPNPQRKLANDSSQVSSNNLEKYDTNGINRGINYPNPFINYTYLKFNLPKDENNLSIRIKDLLGREISKFTNDYKKGINYYKFDGATLKPGYYIYEVIGTSVKITGKMVKVE